MDLSAPNSPSDSGTEIEPDSLTASVADLNLPPDAGSAATPTTSTSACTISAPAPASAAKKKKKKKKKKAAGTSAGSTTPVVAGPPPLSSPAVPDAATLSRSKHTKFISCYHVSGPWLQLPNELIQTLLLVNSGPAPGSSVESTNAILASTRRRLARDDSGNYNHPPSSTVGHNHQDDPRRYLEGEDDLRQYEGQIPPPVDPTVFRTATTVRKLVEDASDLAVRASATMSMYGDSGGGGSGAGSAARRQGLSNSRQHRLRLLAVGKLARAFSLDEIACSVVVMQGSTALEDLAEKVLKVEPENADALYVHHFQERIPGRTYAASTTTKVFDALIAGSPERLDYHRSKGVCLSQKQEYQASIKTLTHALSLLKAARKSRRGNNTPTGNSSNLSARYPNGTADSTAEAAASPTAHTVGGGELAAEEDYERQLLFTRGMSYLHAAHALIEDAVLCSLEKKGMPSGGLSSESGELPLSAFGLDVDIVQGLYNSTSTSPTSTAHANEYRAELSNPALREKVALFLRRACRDHERFLSSFPIWEAPAGSVFEREQKNRPYRPHDHMLAFRGRRLCHHRALSRRTRHGDPRTSLPSEPALLTSYHPLLIESHFSVLLCHLMLGDFAGLVPLHYRASRLMDYLESYPAFIVARSLCQTEYVELLERLAVTWLVEREDVQGIGKPDEGMSEMDIALRGDLHSLHHLVGYFTAEYDVLLNAAADKDEEQSRREDGGKNHDGPSVVDHRSAAAIQAGKTKQDQARELLGIEPPLPKGAPREPRLATAKSEIVLAYLRAAVLPELEGSEKEGKGKGKAEEVDEEVDDEVGSLVGASGKGKGKGKDTGKGKGKARDPGVGGSGSGRVGYQDDSD